MNPDDPKLTAFALDELDEPERSTVARQVQASPEAQRFIAETREMAQALRNEFSTALGTEGPVATNLIDIHDEPWFWSRARPLAMAAAVATIAVIGAIVLGNFRSRHDFSMASPGRTPEIQAEEPPASEDAAQLNEVPNPLRRDIGQRIERIVIGELDADPRLENGEMRVIETINDFYRLQHLRQRLTLPALSRKEHRNVAGRAYGLMFLDGHGRIVACATFYRVPDFGFVLQPSKHGSEKNGHYFPNRGNTPLPGEWQPGIDYLGCVIPFPDWNECIGYSPGV
jgi:hypothetical protein